MNKKYQERILANLEPWFDNSILIGSVLLFFISLAQWRHNQNLLHTTFFFLPGILYSFLYIFKNKINLVNKTFLAFIPLFSLVILGFNMDSFSSSGFVLLILINFASFIILTPILVFTTALFTGTIITYYIFKVQTHSIVYDSHLLTRLNASYHWAVKSIIFFAVIATIAITIYTLKNLIFKLFKEIENQILKTEDQAFIDPLTKLYNRNGFINTIEDKLKHAEKGIFLLFDVSDFKSINTLYGTDVGDEVLRTIGLVFDETKNPHTTIARFGSNEFALYTTLTDLKEIERRFFIANQKVKERLSIKHPLTWHVVCVKYPEHGSDFVTIYENATIAIKDTKEKRSSDFISFQPDMRNAFEKEALIKDQLKTALADHEFYFVFQKKINAVTNEITGVEALIRWESRTLGFIPPDIFIKLLTKSNLMYEFSKQTIRKAMTEFHNAKHLGDHVKLSINVSPTFVTSPDFTDIILEGIKNSYLSSDRLILEVTEDVMVYDLEDLQEKVKILKNYGIQFSLDDFGTGFSSLKYLTAIAFDEIKIDKAFIDNILTNPSDYDLLKSIIALTNVLNYNVVAEGVETKEQLEAVLKAGCNTIQGYYYARPESLEDIKKSYGL